MAWGLLCCAAHPRAGQRFPTTGQGILGLSTGPLGQAGQAGVPGLSIGPVGQIPATGPQGRAALAEGLGLAFQAAVGWLGQDTFTRFPVRKWEPAGSPAHTRVCFASWRLPLLEHSSRPGCFFSIETDTTLS